MKQKSNQTYACSFFILQLKIKLTEIVFQNCLFNKDFKGFHRYEFHKTLNDIPLKRQTQRSQLRWLRYKKCYQFEQKAKNNAIATVFHLRYQTKNLYKSIDFSQNYKMFFDFILYEKKSDITFITILFYNTLNQQFKTTQLSNIFSIQCITLLVFKKLVQCNKLKNLIYYFSPLQSLERILESKTTKISLQINNENKGQTFQQNHYQFTMIFDFLDSITDPTRAHRLRYQIKNSIQFFYIQKMMIQKKIFISSTIVSFRFVLKQ
eukprot:TRINITY_DN10972_c1_g1_i13.p1 TRINITY_DN10972_c1_g1~~TRINITY_DN10972_c1_g1_i13.p1  ORF type:complete len:264 (-),score=-22.96 TRINITY_DN10972_c1_g1_i13:543-1334(-)